MSIFAKYTDDELLDYCRELYEDNGIVALTYNFLKTKKLYFTLYNRGIKPRDLARKLDLEDEYKSHLESRPTVREGVEIEKWTWDKVIRIASEVAEQQGFLPAAAWFQDNGHGSLVQAIYALDKNWENLREQLDDFNTSQFVESRNGMRWLSHPEASFSNFLYARGIEHKRGERYPDDYATFSGRAYGHYDIHFKGRDGWVDVEIWGDKPHGHNEENYRIKRESKEQYNKRNSAFLGIEYRDCYSDSKLEAILVSWVELSDPYVFDRPTDRLIESSHWSNADELLEFCQQLASQMPDGKFPTEEWLRKRGKWSDREGETYNTASIYIKNWLGGVRNLRKLLGQSENSTQQWDRDSALRAWHQFWKETGMTPGQLRHTGRKDSACFTKGRIDEAARIDSAVLKYVGGALIANEELGISLDKTRRWTREAILEGYRDVFKRWEASPSQVIHDYRKGRLNLAEADYKRICQMIDATGRQFKGAKEVYQIIGLKPPSRPRRR